jgi:hypothetical protein
MNRFIYHSKGVNDSEYPTFYIIETELNYDQLKDYLHKEAKRHAADNNNLILDDYLEEFYVTLEDKTYFFCLGDHIKENPSYETVFHYDQFFKDKKIKIGLEQIL